MITWTTTPNASLASLWSSSKKSIYFCFAALKTTRRNLCLAGAIDWGSTYFLGNTVKISPNVSHGADDIFKRLQRITKHKRAEVIYLVICCELPVSVWTCFEETFKHFKFLWLPTDCRQCCCERFWQFRNSDIVKVEVRRIAAARQLLKGQQNLVCFNCRRGVLTAKMWLTCGARPLLFS